MKQHEKSIFALKRVLDAAITSGTEIRRACVTWLSFAERGRPANDPQFAIGTAAFTSQYGQFRAKKDAKIAGNLPILVNRRQKWESGKVSRLTAWMLGLVKFQDIKLSVKTGTPSQDSGHSAEWPFSFLRPVTPAARRLSPDLQRVPFPVSSRPSADFRPSSP